MKKSIICSLTIVTLLAISGCTWNKAAKGGTIGAGAGAATGALVGVAAGAPVAGIAIGTALAGGVGYIIGNEMDKDEAKKAAKQPKQIAVAPAAKSKNILAGTTWRAKSIIAKHKESQLKSMIVAFQTDSKVSTVGVTKEGKAVTHIEQYRIVGDTIVVSGKKDGKPYMINAKFSIKDKQMIVSAPGLSIVLEQV